MLLSFRLHSLKSGRSSGSRALGVGYAVRCDAILLPYQYTLVSCLSSLNRPVAPPLFYSWCAACQLPGVGAQPPGDVWLKPGAFSCHTSVPWLIMVQSTARLPAVLHLNDSDLFCFCFFFSRKLHCVVYSSIRLVFVTVWCNGEGVVSLCPTGGHAAALIWYR